VSFKLCRAGGLRNLASQSPRSEQRRLDATPRSRAPPHHVGPSRAVTKMSASNDGLRRLRFPILIHRRARGTGIAGLQNPQIVSTVTTGGSTSGCHGWCGTGFFIYFINQASPHTGSSAVLISTLVARVRCTGHFSAISSRRLRCSALSGPMSRSDRSMRSIKAFLSSQSARSRS
jgi:hypothetical protein